jgi:hypothetical protein
MGIYYRPRVRRKGIFIGKIAGRDTYRMTAAAEA